MAKIYTKNTWADEVLTGAERYNIRQNDGTLIDENIQIELNTAVAQAGSLVTASRMNNIENGIDALDTKVSDLEDSASGAEVRFPAGDALTIASGAITITGTGKLYTVACEGGSSPDDLITINGGSDGDIIFIRIAVASTVWLKHNEGNLWISAGQHWPLNETARPAMAIYNAALAKWLVFVPYTIAQDVRMNAKGDLLVASGNRAAATLAVGTNAQKLVADSVATSGLRWIDDDMSLEVILGDGVNVLSTGVKGFVEAPYDFMIESVTLLADASGSCVIDIWKDTYANFPPADADSITASAQPTLSSAQKSQDATLTGWTKTVAKGDILAFNVDSAGTVKQVTLSIKGRKTAVS